MSAGLPARWMVGFAQRALVAVLPLGFFTPAAAWFGAVRPGPGWDVEALARRTVNARRGGLVRFFRRRRFFWNSGVRRSY